MRIAVSGTHGSGKTTLIDDFVAAYPAFAKQEEPYWSLVQHNVAFANGASVPDLEQQLAASVEMLLADDDRADTVFDRCPIDFIAYLEVVSESEGLDWVPTGKLLGRIERALESLDLLILLPLGRPDEITTPIELPRLRQRVDLRLKSIFRDDSLGLFHGRSLRLVEISGSRARRLRALAEAGGVS